MHLPLAPSSLPQQFGSIDIYLFDQMLRGRIADAATVLDAGCGSGRNLVFMLRAGMNVFGVDASAEAIASVHELAASLAPSTPRERLMVQPLDEMSFADESMDVVVCSAVLHFARDEAHFNACVRELWRVLVPGGMLFCRLASTIGIETQVRPLAHRWHVLPDGSERFLVDADLLHALTARLGGTLLDPLKTTVVEGMWP